MVYRFTDCVMPVSLRDRMKDDYQHWRQSILEVRLLTETQLKKLYKLNFRPADIEAGKHYRIFPKLPGNPALPQNRLVEPGERRNKRGRSLPWVTIESRLLLVMQREADRILREHRLEPADLDRLRAVSRVLVGRLAARPKLRG